MITPAQLDYFEQLPVLPDELGFCEPFESLSAMERAVEIFPDFVTLIQCLRLATVQPGSPLFGQHVSLTERWIAMLARSLMEDGPHLDRLIPLTYQMVEASIQDPLPRTQGEIGLAQQVLEVLNPNSPARAWLDGNLDKLDLMKNGRIVDQFNLIYPDVFVNRVSDMLDELDPTLADLVLYARAQNSEALRRYQVSLSESVHLKELAHNDPIRLAVLGEDVSANEYARRLKLLADHFARPLQAVEASGGISAEEFIRKSVRAFKGLLDHMPGFCMEDFNIDLYAVLRDGRYITTSYKKDVAVFLSALGDIGADICRLAASVVGGSWGVGRLDAEQYGRFVTQAVDACNNDLDIKVSTLLYREFLMRTPEENLLNANLGDREWAFLYKLRPSPTFLHKIQGEHHLEGVLSGDLGL
ncbi:hypothetical protein [Pseudomonas sp. S1(2024)]|uniref:hypothetical protein n=1 Tax=Pseudomonas sp. S1(2024) TaxID=3390191 RepID=UPI00397C3241